MKLDLELEQIFKTIKDRKCKLVGLQFPEGLKRQAIGIARIIEEKTGAKAIISGNSCFGACDIDTTLAGNVDLLFHFGHAPMDDHENVVFIEARSDIDVIPVVKKAIQLLNAKRIGLITTVQHAHTLKKVSEFLKEQGKKAVIGKGDPRIRYPGQVLGCNFTAARIDCEEYLYIGSGFFHPLGVAIATKKKVIAADPALNKAVEVDPEAFLRKRGGNIARAMGARIFGIIVSTKSGQNRIELAQHLVRIASKHRAEAYIIMMDLIMPEQLLAFKIDAYVNTACPRIAFDDAERFHVPVLTPQEFEIVLGERDWKDLLMDEMLED